jgi:hypothetical protein
MQSKKALCCCCRRRRHRRRRCCCCKQRCCCCHLMLSRLLPGLHTTGKVAAPRTATREWQCLPKRRSRQHSTLEHNRRAQKRKEGGVWAAPSKDQERGWAQLEQVGGHWQSRAKRAAASAPCPVSCQIGLTYVFRTTFAYKPHASLGSIGILCCRRLGHACCSILARGLPQSSWEHLTGPG